MGTKQALDEPLYVRLGDAARAIGTERFYVALLAAMKALAPWDAADVVRYSRYAAPDYLYQEGLDPETIVHYRAGIYRFDPFFRWWREHGEGAVLTLRGASRPVDLVGEYFTKFVPNTGMFDNLAVFLPSIARTAVALFVECRKKRYTPTIVERVRAVYPLFVGLHDAHLARTLADLRHDQGSAEGDRAIAVLDRDRRTVFTSPAWRAAERSDNSLADPAPLARALAAGSKGISSAGPVHAEPLGPESPLAPGGTLLVIERGTPALPPLDFDGIFASFAEGRLTPRETQIARLMLGGYPTEAIAKTLGIGRGTVKNHRRRLYDRLDITTERELFSQFLEFLSQPRAG